MKQLLRHGEVSMETIILGAIALLVLVILTVLLVRGGVEGPGAASPPTVDQLCASKGMFAHVESQRDTTYACEDIKGEVHMYVKD